jgi:anti-sigma-K factor RskA
LTAAQDDNNRLATVLSAPDARTVTVAGRQGGNATLVVSVGRAEGVVVTSGLPAAGEHQTYQLWLIGADGARPAGLLGVDATGHGQALVSGPFVSAEKFGVTVEPAGGSKQPTTTPVMLVDVPIV